MSTGRRDFIKTTAATAALLSAQPGLVVDPAAQATAKLLSGRPVIEAIAWLKLLLAFDLVFVVACMLAYPFTLEE